MTWQIWNKDNEPLIPGVTGLQARSSKKGTCSSSYWTKYALSLTFLSAGCSYGVAPLATKTGGRSDFCRDRHPMSWRWWPTNGSTPSSQKSSKWWWTQPFTMASTELCGTYSTCVSMSWNWSLVRPSSCQNSIHRQPKLRKWNDKRTWNRPGEMSTNSMSRLMRMINLVARNLPSKRCLVGNTFL